MKTISNTSAVADSLAPDTTAAYADHWIVQVPETFAGRKLWTAYGGAVCATKKAVELALPQFRAAEHRVVRPNA